MKHIGDDFIAFLKKSITQLEELQVQAELGKEELKDNYHIFKNDFTKKVNQIKKGETLIQKNITGKLIPLKQKVDVLEVQFALGKAEAKDKIEEEIKNLKHQFTELKLGIKKWFTEKTNSTI